MKEPADDPWFTRTQSRLRKRRRDLIASVVLGWAVYTGCIWIFYRAGVRNVAFYLALTYLIGVPVIIGTLGLFERFQRLRIGILPVVSDVVINYLVLLIFLAVGHAEMPGNPRELIGAWVLRWLFDYGPVRVLVAALLGVALLRHLEKRIRRHAAVCDSGGGPTP